MSTVSQVGADFNYLGNTNVALVAMGARNAIDGRRAWMMTWEGTQGGIDAYRATFPATGQEISIEFIPGGRSRMTAVFGDNPTGSETPVEEWSYEEIPTQPSIWTMPEVAAIVRADPSKKRAIEETLATSTPANPYSGDAVLTSVFNLLLDGTTAWETNRPIVRLVKSYVSSSITRRTLTQTSTVYSRTSLISTFSVPSFFQPQIPADPSWTAPDDATWGWRKGPQRGSWNRGTGRYDEESIFEGAFWAEGLYTFV